MQDTPLIKTPQYDDEIDFRELWLLLRNGWKAIATATVVAAIASLLYGFSLTEIYRSEALLAPAETRQPSNPLLNQFGAAAGLIGINVSENDSKISAAIATLQSRQFIKEFISAHEILPYLMASSWNAETDASEIYSALYDIETGTWRSGQPTEEEAYKAFREILYISENATNQMVTIAVEWLDPRLAQQWVNWLVQDINNLLKKQDQQEAQNAIEYLQNQLRSTQLIEMQNIFYQLIESQMRVVMLADVRDEYVFRVVDPAFIPEEKIRPRKAIIAILGTSAGFMFALVYLIVMHYLNRQQTTQNGKSAT